MTIGSMLGQSAILTLLGMCVVFSFLIILIGAMNLLRIAVKAFKLDKEDSNSTALPSAGAVNTGVDQNAVVAAIAVALKEKK